MELDYETMFEAGVHIGHQVKRWNPKFGSYLYKHLHGISVIDLEKTRACLEKAAAFLTEQIKDGATVLLVGTKSQSQELIRGLGQATGMPFCANRWLGGCLTNFKTVKASLAKYKRFLAMEESGELDKMFKKESSAIRREMVRMHRGFEGLLELNTCPNVLFAVDAMKEAIALREARRLQIPTVGIVDTNSDPSLLDYPIPANDDSVKALRVLFEYLQEAMEQGVELAKLNKAHKFVPTEVATGERAKSWMSRRPAGGLKSGNSGASSGKRDASKGGSKKEPFEAGAKKTDASGRAGVKERLTEAEGASKASEKRNLSENADRKSDAVASKANVETSEKSVTAEEPGKTVVEKASSETVTKTTEE